MVNNIFLPILDAIFSNMANPATNTPLDVLPLNSLLIFSSISLIAWSIGLATLQLQDKIAVMTTENREINDKLANTIANCFLSLSEKSAIATLMVFASAITYSIGLNIWGYIFKSVVFILLGWSFLKLTVEILKLKKRDMPAIKEYEEIQEKFLLKPNA